MVKATMEAKIQVLELEGDVVYDRIPDYKKSIKDLLRPAEGYIIDFCGVTRLDSTGLGLIISVAKDLMKENKIMVLAIEDDFIKELFTIAKLDRVFPIVETVEAGIKALSDDDGGYMHKVDAY